MNARNLTAEGSQGAVATDTSSTDQARTAITAGDTALGIELGSTNIKAVLIGPDFAPLATASSTWENQFVDRIWTYSLEAVWSGIQAAVAGVLADAERQHGVRPTTVGALGVSAMMHGYLAFDAEGELLVPFRTWRNTNTGRAAAELTDLLDYNVPLRWSIAHYHHAILEQEPHVAKVDFLTTLAGYVHWQLTGRKVLGVGDASGMFPIDTTTHTYDASMLAQYDALAGDRSPKPLVDLLPHVLVAGEDAGTLTEQGARLLDPTGTLQPGIPLCPPEGDAGTGMVATNSVAPRTGNISAGTSIFAMIVLEKALSKVHEEVDIVTTPAGDGVAMVHCNNGASELAGWAGVLGEFAAALGHPSDPAAVFGALLPAALDAPADGGGWLAYNYLAGEPITGTEEGRPLIVRTPDSQFTLAAVSRALVYGMFGTLSLGMKVLEAEGVGLDAMYAHGGVFRTAGVAQRLLAAAINAPVAVGATASEGGPWGIAVLAAYRRHGDGQSLPEFLTSRVFAATELDVVDPDADDVAGYASYLERYQAGLAVQRAAIEALH